MCLSIRMESGVVYVAWPFRGRIFLHLRDHFDGKPEWVDGVVHCEPWQAHIDLVRLPPIPPLPTPNPLPRADDFLVHLATIAVGHNFLVGLTNFGHVLKFSLQLGDLEDQDGENVGIRVLNTAITAGHARWDYVSNASAVS